jgi:hypothetical protein
MITSRASKIAVAAAVTAALLAGIAGPATADDLGADGVTGKTPLVDYVQQVREFPATKAHKYRYSTTWDFWSVVAVETNGAAGDVDLDLYDDASMTQLLELSDYGVGVTDFVAVDTDHRPPGSYFPKVRAFSGTGAYVIELAQGDDVLDSTMQTIPTTVRDVVYVRDTYLVADETYYFSATPTSNVDVGIFLMASDPVDSETWVQRRSDAASSDVSGPAGEAERISFRPTISQWYGVVVTTQGGDGSFQLRRYQRADDRVDPQLAP